MQKKYILGIDIGGTNFRTGLVTESYTVEDFRIKPSLVLQNGDFIENLSGEIKDYINEYGSEIEGVGIGFPSCVSKDKKFVYSTPNMKNLDNVNVTDRLSEILNIPVFINKDVNFLMLDDIKKHNMEKDKVVLGFYIGTGFGNAVYINGSILEGKNGVAGELGHIPVMNSEEECPCGNTGCIEIYASGKNLQNILKENFPEDKIDDIFVKHGDNEIIKKYIDTLALPIATEINIFDPDHIIIAGGVPMMRGFPRDYLDKCIYKYARKPYPAENLNIIYSEHDQKSGVLGAAYYIRNIIS